MPVFYPSHIIPDTFRKRVFPIQFSRIALGGICNIRMYILAIKIKRISNRAILPVCECQQYINLPRSQIPEKRFSTFYLSKIYSPPPISTEQPHINIIPVHPFYRQFQIRIKIIIRHFSCKHILKSSRYGPVPHKIAIHVPLSAKTPAVNHARAPTVNIETSPFRLPGRESKRKADTRYIPHHIPHMPFPCFRIESIEIIGYRDADGPHHINHKITSILTLADTIMQQVLSSQMRIVKDPCKPVRVFLLQILPNYANRLHYIDTRINLVQQKGITVMVYLPPVVRSLISDTIGKQPFTEICKRKGSIPRTLFPTIKSQINVIYQEFSPYIQYIRFSLQSGRGIIIPIRYGSILQHHPISICRSQHCFQRIQFFTFKGIVIRHIFYQETSGFIFFRLIFIIFQYLFQFAFVGCSTLQCVLQSAGSIASLQYPGNQ